MAPRSCGCLRARGAATTTPARHALVDGHVDGTAVADAGGAAVADDEAEFFPDRQQAGVGQVFRHHLCCPVPGWSSRGATQAPPPSASRLAAIRATDGFEVLRSW